MNKQLEVGYSAKVWVNQAMRPFVVLAVLGDHALIEYDMPAGRSFLVEVHVDMMNQHDGSATWKTHSEKALPKKWKAEVAKYPALVAEQRAAREAAMVERIRIDKLVAANTGFVSLADIFNSRDTYRPSCCCSDPVMQEIADAFDVEAEKRGDPRRAYRWY